jgi:hypothetical protein
LTDSEKYTVHFFRTPAPLPSNLRNPQALRAKGSPFSITSIDKPPCVRISPESFSSVDVAIDAEVSVLWRSLWT